MDDKRTMIYGANGYTGRLCVQEAIGRGMQPIIAGRNALQLDQMARQYSLEARVFDLADPIMASNHMGDVHTVLNCAGPFSATARPMLQACVHSKTNYLDVTGEINIFEYVHNRRQKWIDAAIAVIPGVGFDVVPTDCLAAMLKKALPSATRLVLAMKTTGSKLSPGTAKTIAEGISYGSRIRRDGYITEIPLASKTMLVPFQSGTSPAFAIPWGDVSTAWYTTGIPDIEVYMGAREADIRQVKRLTRLRWLFGFGPFQRFLQRQIARCVTGPTEAERAQSRVELYGEVSEPQGARAVMTMTTPDGYDLTSDAAISALERVLGDAVAPGAHTPANAFGSDFALSLRGVTFRRVQ